MSLSCASGAVIKMQADLPTGAGRSPSPQQLTLFTSMTRNENGLAAQAHHQTE